MEKSRACLTVCPEADSMSWRRAASPAPVVGDKAPYAMFILFY